MKKKTKYVCKAERVWEHDLRRWKGVVELHEGGLKFPAGGDIHRQKGIK